MMKSPPSCPAISFKTPGYRIAAAPLILTVFVSTYIRPAGFSLPAPGVSFPGLSFPEISIGLLISSPCPSSSGCSETGSPSIISVKISCRRIHFTGYSFGVFSSAKRHKASMSVPQSSIWRFVTLAVICPYSLCPGTMENTAVKSPHTPLYGIPLSISWFRSKLMSW